MGRRMTLLSSMVATSRQRGTDAMNTIPRRARQLRKIGSFIAQVNDNAAARPCTSRLFAANLLAEAGFANATAFASD